MVLVVVPVEERVVALVREEALVVGVAKVEASVKEVDLAEELVVAKAVV